MPSFRRRPETSPFVHSIINEGLNSGLSRNDGFLEVSREIAEFKTEAGYHPNVVLDLDYTVAMPRKGSN